MIEIEKDIKKAGQYKIGKKPNKIRFQVLKWYQKLLLVIQLFFVSKAKRKFIYIDKQNGRITQITDHSFLLNKKYNDRFIKPIIAEQRKPCECLSSVEFWKDSFYPSVKRYNEAKRKLKKELKNKGRRVQKVCKESLEKEDDK